MFNRGLLLLCMAVLCSSCSSKNGVAPQNHQPISSPFEVVVEGVQNDGKNLQLVGKITANDAPLILNEGYVRLKGLINLKQKISRELPIIKTILPEDQFKLQTRDATTAIGAGDPVRFFISIPSEETTDYQVELFWRDQAQPQVTIDDITIEGDDCAEPTCEVQYLVDATVTLKGTYNAEFLSVASGTLFKTPGVDLAGLIPENEEIIQVPVSAADEKGEIGLRVRVLKNVPNQASDQYQPTLRIQE